MEAFWTSDRQSFSASAGSQIHSSKDSDEILHVYKTHQDSSAPWQLIVRTLEIDFKICQRNSKKSENAKSRTWLSSNKSKTKPMRHLWCVTVSESLTWMTQSPRPHGATLGIPIPYPARKERLPHAQLPPVFWNSACGLSIYSWMV